MASKSNKYTDCQEEQPQGELSLLACIRAQGCDQHTEIHAQFSFILQELGIYFLTRPYAKFWCVFGFFPPSIVKCFDCFF